jgi:peptide-methionine (S)-S-oxide reductase
MDFEAIFLHTPEQELTAKRTEEELEGSGRFKDRIVTEIAPASQFFKAEEYHQKYYTKRGGGLATSNRELPYLLGSRLE